MYWLITMSKRKPGGCSVTSAEDVREDLQATVRVKQMIIDGVLVWRMIKSDEIELTNCDNVTDIDTCIRSRTNKDNHSGTTLTDYNPSVPIRSAAGLVHGSFSPTLRKLSTITAPKALESVCKVASMVNSILVDGNEDLTDSM